MFGRRRGVLSVFLLIYSIFFSQLLLFLLVTSSYNRILCMSNTVFPAGQLGQLGIVLTNYILNFHVDDHAK